MNFEELPLLEEIKTKIVERGMFLATEVQRRAIPLLLQGQDLLVESKTGTGKTLCYAASILSKVQAEKRTKVLVLVPTRELVLQVEREFQLLTPNKQIGIVGIYGGNNLKKQVQALETNPEIVIGTPGRISDLLGRKKLRLDQISWLVVDEVDELLQMGFREVVSGILKHVSHSRQTIFLSATVSTEIEELSKEYMSSYQFLKIEPERETGPQIEQDYYVIDEREKIDTVCRVMDQFRAKRTIIFCRTKKNADFVFERLVRRGYATGLLHGDIVQADREKTLDQFQKGAFPILIATDVVARGIHVDEVELIINFNLPETKEQYIHRIGRTGRIFHHGRAVSLVTKVEEKEIHKLEEELQTMIHLCKLPSYEEILQDRADRWIAQIEREKNLSATENLFTDYVKILSIEELRHITAWLLNRDLLEQMNLNYELKKEIKRNLPQRKEKIDHDHGIRVFLTIGKKDRIGKKELLDYLEKTAHLKTGDCYHVEVHDKFTFLNVKKDAYDALLKFCNGTQFHNQTIHIEKAK